MSAEQSRPDDEAVQPETGDEAVQPAGPPRSVTRSIASVILGFELIVVFLASLVNWGLPTAGLLSLGPVGSLVAGGVLCLLILVTLALLRHRWALWLGWAVQVLILLGGLFNPAMFFVGALFTAIWAYGTIRATRVDRWNLEQWNKENR